MCMEGRGVTLCSHRRYFEVMLILISHLWPVSTRADGLFMSCFSAFRLTNSVRVPISIPQVALNALIIREDCQPQKNI